MSNEQNEQPIVEQQQPSSNEQSSEQSNHQANTSNSHSFKKQRNTKFPVVNIFISISKLIVVEY